jgi:hypothetical protein
MTTESEDKYKKNPETNKIIKNRNSLYSDKIRIYNALKQFVISPLFYFWSEFDNFKVKDSKGEICGYYNVYTDNKKTKYLVISNDKVLAYISLEILDFDKAINISEIDPEKYNEWKNVIE